MDNLMIWAIIAGAVAVLGLGAWIARRNRT